MSVEHFAKTYDHLLSEVFEKSTTGKTGLEKSIVDGLRPYVSPQNEYHGPTHDVLNKLDRTQYHRLLDFGCGGAGHRSKLEEFGFDWHGLDIERAKSQAVRDEKILYYDGYTSPYESESFDLIYSFLVFEHVQDPHLTFSECLRMLRPGGLLAGQVAYLEQQHHFSTFNLTPFGFQFLCEKHGFEIVSLTPRHDVFSFLHMRLFVTLGLDRSIWNNALGGREGLFTAIDRKFDNKDDAALVKLIFSTHYAFVARRPSA